MSTCVVCGGEADGEIVQTTEHFPHAPQREPFCSGCADHGWYNAAYLRFERTAAKEDA
jgi:hypothetical protein